MDLLTIVGFRVALEEEQVYITPPGSTVAVLTQGPKASSLLTLHKGLAVCTKQNWVLECVDLLYTYSHSATCSTEVAPSTDVGSRAGSLTLCK